MADASTNTGKQPATLATPAQACQKCNKTDVELSRCERCDIRYCSRSCQIQDWKTHKKTCARNRGQPANNTNTNTSTASPPSSATQTTAGLQQSIPNPFTRIDNGTYLHDRPPADVYKLLIDTYRLRMDDVSKFEGVKEADSLYAPGVTDALPGFRRFLATLKFKSPRYLPDWWDDEKQAECEALGATAAGWSSLRRKVDKAAVSAHYRNDHFPMQLRMFAGMVYGRGIMGQDGTTMRRMMMQMEA